MQPDPGIPEITGGVLSILMLTDAEFDRPAPFLAEQVSLVPAVSAVSVVGAQSLDETSAAQLKLGDSYLQQFVPGVQTPENLEFANKAVEAFERVYNKYPGNAAAVAGLASVYQNTNQIQKAREY